MTQDEIKEALFYLTKEQRITEDRLKIITEVVLKILENIGYLVNEIKGEKDA